MPPLKFISNIDNIKVHDFLTKTEVENKNVEKLANLLNNEENKRLLEEFLFNGAIIERDFEKDDIDLLKNIPTLTYEQCITILVNNSYYTELRTIYKILEAGLISREARNAFWKACNSFIYDLVFKRVFKRHPDIKEKNELDIYYYPDDMVKTRYYNAYCERNYRRLIDSWGELTEEDIKAINKIKSSKKTKDEFREKISFPLFEQVMESIRDKIKPLIKRGNVLRGIFDKAFPSAKEGNEVSAIDFKSFCREKQGKIDSLKLPDWFIEKEELNSTWNNSLTTDYMDFIYYLRTKFLQEINEGITAARLLDLIKKEGKETQVNRRIFYIFKYGEDKEMRIAHNLLKNFVTAIRGSELSSSN